MKPKTKRAKRTVVMDAQEFAANCLSLIDEIYKHNLEAIITRDGVP